MAEKQYIREMPEYKMKIAGQVIKVDSRQFKDGPVRFSLWVMTDTGEIIVVNSTKEHKRGEALKDFWVSSKSYTFNEVLL